MLFSPFSLSSAALLHFPRFNALKLLLQRLHGMRKTKVATIFLKQVLKLTLRATRVMVRVREAGSA